MVGADERGTLGNSVAVDEVETDIVEEFCNLGTNRRTAANNLFELAAEALKNKSEELTALVNALSTKLVALFNKLIELLLHTLLFDVFHNALIHRLGDCRHNINIGRLVDNKIFEHCRQTFIDAKRGMMVEGYENIADRFIGVMIGQERKSRVVNGGNHKSVINA